LREAISEAVYLGIPVLVGVPMRNLERWRAFTGAYSVKLPVDAGTISNWLASQGLPVEASQREVVPRDAALVA
jgi:hypothetical protein